MIRKHVFGALAGLVFGAAGGWLLFGTVTGALGLGCAFASTIYGLRIAFSSN